jgi:hypothetical protein
MSEAQQNAQDQAMNDYDEYLESMGEELADESEATKGFTATIIPEGVAMFRMIEYIELGKHEVMHQGKPKKNPYEKVRVGFELFGKKFPAEEIEVDGKTVLKPFVLRLELTKSLNEKSSYFKLYKLLNWEGKAKHMAQLAAKNSQGILEIVHNKKGEGKDEKTYANASKKETGWTFRAPFRDEIDADGSPTGEKVLVNVPKPTIPTRIFLFMKPRLVDWAKLYIDGTKDDGTSKNWLQLKIKSALDFAGSPLEALLSGADLGEEPPAKGAAKEEKKSEEKKAPVQQKGDDLGDI